MLRCTYIVLIHNNQDNIPTLVDSLKKTSGNFRKEFVFVDDGSTDNSLNILKTAVNDIPRTTIITQEMQGPTISVNKAISLATGDYVHFVEGNEILCSDSTSALIEACLTLGTEVAIGLVTTKGEFPSAGKVTDSSKIIANPIEEILNGKTPIVCNVGKSGSIVHSKLLEKIGKADSSVYTQNTSLSLKCAKYTKFALVDKAIAAVPDLPVNADSKFDAYNNLKSIYNFAKDNPEIFSKLIPQLLKALGRESTRKYDKAGYAIRAFTSKYIKPASLDQVLLLYKQELEKLF
ncbi:MAG: hypothetical protein Tsb006_6740 [Rickettsiaceae bacterium]